jgi:predicted DNA-binding transcriptional regulator
MPTKSRAKIILTDLQAQTEAFIRDFSGEHGRSPSCSEIGREFDISENAAWQRVEALIRRGRLYRPRGTRMQLVLTDPAEPPRAA